MNKINNNNNIFQDPVNISPNTTYRIDKTDTLSKIYKPHVTQSGVGNRGVFHFRPATTAPINSLS